MILDKLTQENGILVVQTQRGQVKANNAYSQWNLCDYTGDDALRVLDARVQFCQQLGIDLDHLVMPRQTHSTNVKVIDQDFIDAKTAQEFLSRGINSSCVMQLRSECINSCCHSCMLLFNPQN